MPCGRLAHSSLEIAQKRSDRSNEGPSMVEAGTMEGAPIKPAWTVRQDKIADSNSPLNFRLDIG